MSFSSAQLNLSVMSGCLLAGSYCSKYFFNQENCDFQSPEPHEDGYSSPDLDLFVSNTLT